MSEFDGEAIREARESRGWSQEFLAAKVGTTQSTIDRIETGQTRRSRVLPDVLRVLDLAVEENGRQSPEPPTVGEFQKVDYVLPKELVDAVNKYRSHIGVASDDEAVRRILSEFMGRRESIRQILEKLMSKYRLLRSMRQAAGLVLASHPLVKTIRFDSGGIVYFELEEENLKVTVMPWGSIQVKKPDNKYYLFDEKGSLPTLDDDNVAKEDELSDELPF